MKVQLVTLLAVFALTGCATVDNNALASRFIRQGTPTVDLGGPRLASQRAPSPRVPLGQAGMTSNVSRTSGTLSSFESRDPDLRDALARVTIAPTAAHHLRVARAYQRAGILDQAYDYLSRSLIVNGPDPAVYEARARLLRDWGNPDLGLADAYRAVHLAPQSAAMQNTLGTLLYKLGHRQEAEDRFTQAMTLDAIAWYALANLCHSSLARGRTREAIMQCRQATAARTKSKP
jgi:Flp pilus assembly protein TadD